MHKHWADLLLHKGVDGVDDESLYSCPAAMSMRIILCTSIGSAFAAPESFSFGRYSRKQLVQAVSGEVRSKDGWQGITVDMLTCLYWSSRSCIACMAAMRPETEGSVLLSLSGCVCSVCSTPVGSTCRHQMEISSAKTCKNGALVLSTAGESMGWTDSSHEQS